MSRWWIALALVLAPTGAVAQTIDITLDPDAQAAGLDEAALESSLNDAVSGALKLGTQAEHQAFIDAMVEAAAISAKGMGVDYASNMKHFVFGGSIGSGVHAAGVKFNRGQTPLPEDGGFGAQISLMGGINLGMGGDHNLLDRLRLYANGLAMKLPSDRYFGGQMANAGAHLQIKVVEGNHRGKVIEWGGLDLTSGFEYSAYSFDLRKDLPVSGPAPGGGKLTWTATGSYNINSDILSVPVEASTNLRILVFTGYVGAAYDYNMGTGTSAAKLDGPLDARIQAPDGTTLDQQIGTATVTANADGTSVPYNARVFLGAQVNITALKGFAHLNISPQGDALSVGGHVGLRAAM